MSNKKDVLKNRNYDDYLLSNMRRLKDTNIENAKAWLITARSLFPNDFRILFECYTIVRDYKMAKDAAFYFSELMEKFPGKSEVLSEMRIMIDSLCPRPFMKSQGVDLNFVRIMFQNLSDDQKSKVLTTIASLCQDPMKHCAIMLLLLKEVPLQLDQHGEKVVNTLLFHEKSNRCEYPVNQFRKLLICEALPAILSNSNFKINSKLLQYIMQSTIEYFITSIFASSDEDFDSEFSNVLKMNESLSSKRIHKMWKPLFILLKAGGHQLKWTLVELLSPENNFLDEMNWELIVLSVQKKLPRDNTPLAENNNFDNPAAKEAYTFIVVIYFYALYQFVEIIDSKFFLKTASPDARYVLIEGIHTSAGSENLEVPHKKIKYDQNMKELERNPLITVSHGMSSELADKVIPSFITSLKMWDLIHQNYNFRKEFSQLTKVVEFDKWRCFQEFYIDMLIYQNCHKEAIPHLKRILQFSNDEFIKNKALLQLASCLNYIGENLKACECVFDIICSLSHTNVVSNTSHIKLPLAKATRHLYCIPYSPDVILYYCIELLICIYKEKVTMKKITVDDSVLLGHVVILCQHKWPREEEFFLRCMRIIKFNGTFCYDKFFDYVIMPGILGEFMYLTTSEGGNVTLDLLPTSTMQIGKQRSVTRGVNKGAKDDLKYNMRKQMARCQENLNEVLIAFIQRERYCIEQTII